MSVISLSGVLLLSPGPWLVDELPSAWWRPGTASIRLVAQVAPIWSLGEGPVSISTSLTTQTLRVAVIDREQERWGLDAGLQTHLLVPSGLDLVLHMNTAHWHVGLGGSLSSGAGWGHLDWSGARLVPALTLAWMH